MTNKGFWANLTSRLFIFIALLAIAAISVGIVKSLIKRAEIEGQIQSLKNQISAQKSRAEQLSHLLEYLNTAEFGERQARLQLGLQKPGEAVVIIPGDSSAKTEELTNEEGSQGLTNFQRWLKYLFNS